MTTYTVHMINFGLNKGTFPTAEEAIAQAKAIGFECAIWVNEPNKDPLHLCNVKPYQEYKMDSRSVSAFDFLQRAERYAEARGDENFFKNFYVNYREYNSVTDSVWKTLSYLYGDDVANMLEFQ